MQVRRAGGREFCAIGVLHTLSYQVLLSNITFNYSLAIVYIVFPQRAVATYRYEIPKTPGQLQDKTQPDK